MQSVKKEHALTYDETVYAVLAAQLSENPANYNTVGLYQDALKKGRKLPPYFKKPLFKHPPIFPYLITVSYDLFGRTYLAAFKVPLLFGVLLIPLAYLFGTTLFDHKTGIYAAFLMSIEPISWISSQKIWMETTLAFFSILSLYLFACYLKKYNPLFVIASGIAAGLAVLTKYPGILATFAIAIYALCCERPLFKKKSFLFSLALPFLMLIPWVYWNYRVYGPEIFTHHSGSMDAIRFFKYLKIYFLRFKLLLALIVSAALFVLFLKKKFNDFYRKIFLLKGKTYYPVFMIILFSSLILMLRTDVINSWNYQYIPSAGWKIAFFLREPKFFYLGRLLELSPLYIFSYAALVLFAYDTENRRKYLLLFVFSGIVLTFWIVWGNFQCRYITAVTVPLIVLSAKTQFHIFKKCSNLRFKHMRYIAQGFFLLIIIYGIIKTLIIDVALAIPNSICYF